jgi:hypothetical protein
LTAQPQNYGAPTGSKPPWGKIILFGCTGILLLAIAVVVAVYYGFRHIMKSSPAYDTSVTALRQSPAAAKALGGITEIGSPRGSVETQSSGGGTATLSMSVTGTLGTGEYYATLYRKNGEWFLESGRVEMSDGRSINIAGTPVFASRGPTGGGRQLASSEIDTSGWNEIDWTQQNASFRLPPKWIQKTLSQRELDFRLGEPYSATYLVANAWIWDRNLPT